MRSSRFSTHARLLTLLFLVGLGGPLGCTKGSSDPTPVTPTDFAGDYKGNMVIANKSGNLTFSQTVDKLTVVVKPITGAYTLQLFDDQFILGEISDLLSVTFAGQYHYATQAAHARLPRQRVRRWWNANRKNNENDRYETLRRWLPRNQHDHGYQTLTPRQK